MSHEQGEKSFRSFVVWSVLCSSCVCPVASDTLKRFYCAFNQVATNCRNALLLLVSGLDHSPHTHNAQIYLRCLTSENGIGVLFSLFYASTIEPTGAAGPLKMSAADILRGCRPVISGYKPTFATSRPQNRPLNNDPNSTLLEIQPTLSPSSSI